VIGNPVDLDRFDPDKVDRFAARNTLGLKHSDFVTTVLAQITPWKGQEEAIRAIARVRDRHPDAKLLLVGSAKFLSKATRYDNAAYLERLHRLVAELELAGHVQFLGEREDVPAVLRATDTVLVPSWEEPFGRSVIEAMAMRVPVIATNVGGPAEVIADRKNGMLLAPRCPENWARAISNLIESPALYARIARNGRLRARAFGVDAHAEEVRSVYLHVTGRRGTRAVTAEVVPALTTAKAA
jgi:L-malate glycosyltransferase